jgi:hypothetical protein
MPPSLLCSFLLLCSYAVGVVCVVYDPPTNWFLIDALIAIECVECTNIFKSELVHCPKAESLVALNMLFSIDGRKCLLHLSTGGANCRMQFRVQCSIRWSLRGCAKRIKLLFLPTIGIGDVEHFLDTDRHSHMTH